jgi:hypothetical protein
LSNDEFFIQLISEYLINNHINTIKGSKGDSCTTVQNNQSIDIICEDGSRSHIENNFENNVSIIKKSNNSYVGSIFSYHNNIYAKINNKYFFVSSETSFSGTERIHIEYKEGDILFSSINCMGIAHVSFQSLFPDDTYIKIKDSVYKHNIENSHINATYCSKLNFRAVLDDERIFYDCFNLSPCITQPLSTQLEKIENIEIPNPPYYIKFGNQ